MNKYRATVTGMGDTAGRLIESGLLIIFNNNAPAELADLSVLHTIEELRADVAQGDVVTICGTAMPVLQVGDEANHTLRTLGHCTMMLQGEEVVKHCLPGYIVVDCPKKPEIRMGGSIEING